MSRHRIGATGPLALLAVAGLVAGLAAPAPARADGPVVFEAGSVTADFPREVSWRFEFRTSERIVRLETIRSFPDSDVTLVTEVGAQALGGDRHVVADSSDDFVNPNTPYRLRLRVTTETGIFVGPEASTVVTDERFRWRVRESERIRLHWYEGDDAFAARALRVGEKGIADAEEFLGVKLERKVDLFIYADERSFRGALGPGVRENVGGEAHADIGTMFALIEPSEIGSSWVAEVVPHELTHLVFHVATDTPLSAAPHWLNEGIAVYLTKGYAPDDRSRVDDAISGARLLPLDGLAGQFPTTREGFFLGYAEAVSAVDYMARTYGEAKVGALVRAFGEGLTPDEAFREALGVDAAAFADAWLKEVGAEEPARYGPRTPPPGPLPSDWQGAAQTPAPGGETPAPGSETPFPGATAGPTPGATPDGTPGDYLVFEDMSGAIIVVAVVVLVVVLALLLAVQRRRAAG